MQLNVQPVNSGYINPENLLDTGNHRRDSLGLKHVYLVNSRRSGGLSIGINLNTNNACNWQCVYCQVDGLIRGSAPPVQVDVLETELHSVLDDVFHGDFYSRHNIPPDYRIIRDIAISGNGEPATCREFDRVVDVINQVKSVYILPDSMKIVLITNGSLIHRPVVKKGIRLMAEMNGEIWFKLDSATETGIQSINHVQMPVEKARENLATAAKLCPLWIQTCVFSWRGMPPSPEEQDAYLQFIASLIKEGVPVCGVYLYGLARPSMQKEAKILGRLPQEWLEQYAERIKKTGINVKVVA